MHNAMPTTVEIEYSAGLQRFAAYLGNEPWRRASTCTGCDIKSHCEDRISAFLKQRYDLTIKFKNNVRCEWNQPKQDFLISQFGHDDSILVGPMSELKQDAVTDLITKNQVLVPEMQSLGCGIPCTARSPLNVKAKSNVNCVQEERESTGEAVADILDIVDKHGFDDVTLECVAQLCQITPTNPSDAKYICTKFIERGFWMIHFGIDQTKFGGWPRLREWWVGARHLVASHDVVSAYYLNLLRSMKLPENYFDFTSCITVDDKQRAIEGQRLNIPLRSHWGIREPKKDKSDPNWKHEHYAYFLDKHWPWPPCLDDFPHIDFSGMTHRQCQVIIYVDKLFPIAKDAYIECLDLSPTLMRILTGCEDTDEAIGNESSTASHESAVVKSPWKPHPMTLTGATVLALRIRTDCGIRIRLAEAFEHFRLMGWEDSMWRQPAVGHKMESDVDFIELLTNMAGNAWSALHYCPVTLCLMSTIGKFMKGKDPSLMEAVIPSTPQESQSESSSDSE